MLLKIETSEPSEIRALLTALVSPTPTVAEARTVVGVSATTPATAPTAPPVAAPPVAAPPVAAPPVVTPAPVIDSTAGVELDAAGTPWLEAVHAGSRSKTKAGVWTGKRKVAKEVILAAEAEARAAIAGTPQPAVENFTMPVLETPQPVVSYEEVAERFQEAITRNVITTAMIPEIYDSLQVTGSGLQTDESMRRRLFDHLGGLLAG